MEEDKKKHFIVAFIISVIAFAITPQGLMVCTIGVLSGLLVGFEIYQSWSGTGVAEMGDIIAGSVGVAIAFIIVFITRNGKKD